MRVEDTLLIAEEYGLPHGRYQGTPQILTSDFLVDFDDPQRPSLAIQAKYSADLQKPGARRPHAPRCRSLAQSRRP
ncbi:MULTISPECIES: hypothetical protein [unclassified Halomonas]